MKSIVRAGVALLALWLAGNGWVIGIASAATSEGRQVEVDTGVTRRVAAAAVELPTHGDAIDFEAIGSAVGDARIVMLGEPFHGDGGAIGIRAKLVEYLHEQLGFDVLVLEADFYSLNKGWPEARRTGRVEEYGRENVYSFWSTTNAARPLWAYIATEARRARPLHVAGIDPRHVGTLARRTLPAELARVVALTPSITPDERQRFLAEIERFLQDERAFRPDSSGKTELLSILDRLETTLPPALDTSGFWRQQVRSLRQGILFASSSGDRDRAMGDNFLWVATRLYPTQKIILWAHNNHIITDKWLFYGAPDPDIQARVARRPREAIARATYLGDEVKEAFGDAVYSIALVSHTGTYSPDIGPALYGRRANYDSLATLAPAPAGTLEAALAARGHDLAFIDLRPFRALREPLRTRVLDYAYLGPIAMRLWRGYDGLIFLRTTHGLNQLSPEGSDIEP